MLRRQRSNHHDARAGAGGLQFKLESSTPYCTQDSDCILLVGAYLATYECSPCSDFDHPLDQVVVPNHDAPRIVKERAKQRISRGID